MSSLPIPRSKKISDVQFIGDLMSLLERRGLKCGDADSLESFASDLAADNALCGDLFGLCTAISHLSSEDLTGEQLLNLVARALGGSGIVRGDGLVEIPASMRSGFLDGWEAWSKRGSLMEDSVWPPPRKPVQREESAPAELAAATERSSLGEDGAGEPGGDAEPSAPRARMAGMPTVQEALELARARVAAGGSDPTGFPGGMPGAAGANDANIEGLTLGELKKLLEEIEDRVRRIEPQVQQMISGEPLSSRTGVKAEVTRTPRGAVIAFESAARELPHSGAGGFVEAKFLARHAYLRPKQGEPGIPMAEPSAGSGEAAPAAPGVVPAVAARVEPGLVAAPPAAPADISAAPVVAAPAAADGISVAAATPSAAAEPLPEPAAAPARLAGQPRTAAVGAQCKSVPFVMSELPVGVRIGNVRVSIKTIVCGIAMLVLLAGGLAGAVLYPYLHPAYIYSDSGSKPAAPAVADTAADASGSQVILTAPDSSLMGSPSIPGLHPGLIRAGAKQKGAAVLPPPPVAVWPVISQQAGQDGAGFAASLDAAADAAADAATRRAGLASLAAANRGAAGSGALHVASTTMIGYALASPKPAYPADQAKGISGTVVVAISISKQGNVTNARAVSGPVELRKAAIDAVQEWRFKPYLVAGSPADVTTTLGFFFNGE